MPLTGPRVGAAILTALVLTAAIYWFRADLLNQHNRIAAAVLHLAAVPTTGSTHVDTFEQVGSAEVVLTSVFSPGEQPVRPIALFGLALLILFVVRKTVALASSFLMFLLVILTVTAGIILFWPSSQISSDEFSQIWLRGEVLVWFLLPWLSASLLVLLQRAAWPGFLWAVALQAYAFVWSAIRLAFCLGVLHFSGLLFMPTLWFTLGLLADVLYIIVFLSLSARVSGLRAWGWRTSWQF
ncbi:MAG: hypothetical protein ABI811_21425 [Acidobacteriota bacterium]